MKIARFTTDDTPQYGIVQDGHILALTGDPLYTQVQPTDHTFEVDDVRLLAPVIPRSKVIGVGRNYAAHAAEMGNELPTAPLLFLKPNTAVVGPDDPIVLPPWSHEVEHEGELAVVISRLCRDIPRERVDDVILGYTCANDVSARDAQRAEQTWVRAKGFDTSCPLGPWIETDLDTSALDITCRVGDDVRQHGNTRDMVFSVADLVADISRVFTLLPGDVILTGTPAGVGPLTEGDRVTVCIEGIGELSNPVVRR